MTDAILHSIVGGFTLEISNKFIVDKNSIIIYLADGTKAKITTSLFNPLI